MKKFLYFLVGCGILGAIAGLIISSLPPLVATANVFLINVKQKNYVLAYNMLASELQTQYRYADFVNYVESNRLHLYEDAKWDKEVIDKKAGTGYVSGIIVTSRNEQIPMEIDFVLENPQKMEGGWRIRSFKRLNYR